VKSSACGLLIQNSVRIPGIGVPEEKDYSEETARQMDEEVHDIIEKARQVARNILEQNKQGSRILQKN